SRSRRQILIFRALRFRKSKIRCRLAVTLFLGRLAKVGIGHIDPCLGHSPLGYGRLFSSGIKSLVEVVSAAARIDRLYVRNGPSPLVLVRLSRHVVIGLIPV